MWPRKEARKANYLPLQHQHRVQPDINGRIVIAAAPIDQTCAPKHAETELPAAVSEIRMRVCWPSGGV